MILSHGMDDKFVDHLTGQLMNVPSVETDKIREITQLAIFGINTGCVHSYTHLYHVSLSRIPSYLYRLT